MIAARQKRTRIVVLPPLRSLKTSSTHENPNSNSSVGNPVYEGTVSSHRLTQEELKHWGSHTCSPHAVNHSQGTCLP